jgi:hypothetical protein
MQDEVVYVTKCNCKLIAELPHRMSLFILISRRPASVIAGQSGEAQQKHPFRPLKIEQITRH